jgi:hypothetical protein
MRAENEAALGFHAGLGYDADSTVVLGKRLVSDGPPDHRPR